MKLRCSFCAAVLASGGALAQGSGLATELFLKDLNSTAGVSRIGAALLAVDPAKNSWGSYCRTSQGLAQRGEFRRAIRSAAKALYIGESSNGNYGAPIIWASNDIATAYSYAGDHADAVVWADKTLAAVGRGYDSELRMDVLVISANARRIKALALSHDGRHAEAVAEILKAADLVPRAASPAVKTELAIASAALYIKAGQLAQAGEVLDKLGPQSDPYLAVVVHRAAGDLALARKDEAAAKTSYEAALAAVSGQALNFHATMIHLGLARSARLRGDRVQASAELTQALAGLETMRSSFASSELRTALYGNLQMVFDEAIDFFASNGDWAAALAASEASRARAMLDLQRNIEFTKKASAPAVRPTALDQIQSRLKAGQFMVVYHQLPDRLLAWVVTRDALRGQALPLAADKMRSEVAAFRGAIEQQAGHTVTLAKLLHGQLVEPLKLPLGSELIVVPHKALHLLPFQALHDGTGWLIEHNAVATAMSASLYSPAQKVDGPSRLAALGNPDLGRPEWALPGSEAEVRAIQTLYADSSVFVRGEASKAHLIEIAPAADVVHIAAHAVVDDVDPMYSTIKLAVGPASPDMDARELAQLNLGGVRLVLLSACNSGLGKVADGDEFMGFKRALFIAGARSALVSLWPVDDESTKTLMMEFHQDWKAGSKIQAMQTAQLKLMSNPRYAHPFYWAAFTLIGDLQ